MSSLYGRSLARVGENLVMALETVRTHRVRSGLVILGVAIGVATLMAMVTVLQGFTAKIESEIKDNDRVTFRVVPFTVMERSRMRELRARPQLTAEDRRALLALPELDSVDFNAQQQGTPQVFRFRGEKTRPSVLIGVSESFLDVSRIRLDQGRFFSRAEVLRGAQVIVLGSGPAQLLFPHVSPLGKTVRLDSGEFLVVGTMMTRRSLFGSFAENYGVIPYTTFLRLFSDRERRFTRLTAAPAAGVRLDEATDAVRRVMRQRHRLRVGKPDDFEMVTEDEVLRFTEQLTGPMAIVLVVLSSIALLVGGIGLMAIQLVSVTERTREIGIRKALGARRRDILWQFLIEASTLTGIGGVLGVAGGLGLGALASRIAGFPTIYSTAYSSIAVAFSVGIGIGFGLWPAMQAAKLDPIEALRQE
jgi:putative ABC transport system permease protein